TQQPATRSLNPLSRLMVTCVTRFESGTGVPNPKLFALTAGRLTATGPVTLDRRVAFVSVSWGHSSNRMFVKACSPDMAGERDRGSSVARLICTASPGWSGIPLAQTIGCPTVLVAVE